MRALEKAGDDGMWQRLGVDHGSREVSLRLAHFRVVQR